MNQYQQKKMDNFRAEYATSADFCQVFENNTSQLYLLAFLLTANHTDAERCFVATIDAAFKEHTVFKGWARTWVKRTLIKNAIEIASPLSDRGTGKRHLWNPAQHRSLETMKSTLCPGSPRWSASFLSCQFWSATPLGSARFSLVAI